MGLEYLMAVVNQTGNILIVEDDPDTREMLSTLLSIEGFHAVGAEDGLEGLHLLRTVKHGSPDVPCLILLDLMMPYLDGRDELKLMAMAVDHKIPVIVVTAFLTAGNEEQEFRAAGVVHIVYKPFDLDKLVDLVKKTIGEPEGKRA